MREFIAFASLFYSSWWRTESVRVAQPASRCLQKNVCGAPMVRWWSETGDPFSTTLDGQQGSCLIVFFSFSSFFSIFNFFCLISRRVEKPQSSSTSAYSFGLLIHTMCALRIHVRLIKRPLNSNTHTALELSAWVLAVFIALCVCYINKETKQKKREVFVHIFFLSYFVPSTFAMHSRGLYNHRRIAQNNAHNFQFIIFSFLFVSSKNCYSVTDN